MPPRHRLTVDAPRRPADAALLAALRAPEAAASLLDQLYGTYPGMEPWQLTIAADVAVTGPGGRAAGVLDLDIAGERDFACRLCGEVFDVPEREYDIAKDVCRDHYALRVLEARWDAFDVGLPDPTDWGYEPAVRQPDEPRRATARASPAARSAPGGVPITAPHSGRLAVSGRSLMSAWRCWFMGSRNRAIASSGARGSSQCSITRPCADGWMRDRLPPGRCSSGRASRTRWRPRCATPALSRFD